MNFPKKGIAAHAVLVCLLLVMGVQAVEQVQSGYVPPGMEFTVALALLPLILGSLVAVGVVIWARTGRSRHLFVADGLTVLSAWTVMLPLLMLPGSAMLVTVCSRADSPLHGVA